MDIAIGTALISLQRTIYDANGSAIEINQGLYRPDRYEFRVESQAAELAG